MKRFYGILLIAFFALLSAETQAQNCPLSCNDNVEVALGPDCSAVITPDDILENPGNGCPYTVTVYDPNGLPIGNTVDGSYIGMTLEVRVFLNGNSCWGSIDVEDRFPPVINCQPTVTALCGDANAGGIPSYLVTDNCDPDPEIVIMSDNFQDLPCGNTYTAIRTITYKAVDAAGNESATCTQTIQYERATLNQVDYPLSLDGIEAPSLSCSNNSWDTNGNGYPDSEETGVPTVDGSPIYPNGAYCDLAAVFTDSEIPLCGGGFKVVRNWTVYDWCSSGASSSQIQMIKVEDNSTPSISCPHDITISGGYDCQASAQLPPPFIGGGCSGSGSYTVTVNGGYVQLVNGFYVVSGLKPGEYTALYQVSNPCGGATTTCSMHITVVGGGSGPIPVCDQNTVVALGSDGVARVHASTFNDGSFGGSCGNVSNIKVRRMVMGNCPHGVADDTEFRDFVEFCCADIGQSVQVILRVWDNSGNWNECMVVVHVQDKLPPKIVCPPDLTIDCDYPIDIWDLSAFGTVVADKKDRKPIYIYGYPNDGFAGYDGYAEDNCEEVSITESVEDFRDCGGGYIRRTFTATDWGGLKSTCTQKIFVSSGNGFTCSSINWPKDIELNSCQTFMTDPDNTGRPEFPGAGCGTLLATNYKDEVFPIVDEFCYKIIRTWKVLDWCSYDPDSPHGSKICEYTQVIKVIDSDKPVFVAGCDDVTICTADTRGCEGFVHLEPRVEDCTPEEFLKYNYFIDVNNDNPAGRWDDGGTSKSFNDYVPFGTHRILWKVRDGCGNEETCSYLFTVEDCKQPTPVCIHGITTVVMPSAGAIEVEVDKFNLNSFDNCTPSDQLQFSFSSDVNDKTQMFTCNDLGTNEVEIWVTDEAGNQDYCVTYVIIQDNLGTCPDTSNMIAGQITTPFGVGVPQAAVNFVHTLIQNGTYSMTQTDGNYNLPYSGPMNGDSIMVQPESDWEPLLGVTAYDLYLLQLDILNLTQLDDPYKRIAADIDKDGNITFQDYHELRDFLLRKTTSFPNNDSWRFVDASYDFGETQSIKSLPEMKYVDFYLEAIHNVNFKGVKIGDLDYSGIPGVRGRSLDQLSAEITPSGVGSQEMTIRMQDESMAIVAFEIRGDQQGVIAELEAPGFHKVEKGEGHWIGLATQGQKSFELHLKPSDWIQASDWSTSLINSGAKLIVHRFDGTAFKLRCGGASASEVRFDAVIAPNPFEEMFDLYAELGESGRYDVVITDIAGRKVYERSFEWAEGKQQIQIMTQQQWVSGIYQMSVYKEGQPVWNKRIIKK